MKIINLTPHTITLIANDMTVKIKSSGIARCELTTKQVGTVNGFPINQNTYSDVTGLLDPEEGTLYIVSAIVANAVKGKRNDCIVVDQTVRNSDGIIIGCRGFAII